MMMSQFYKYKLETGKKLSLYYTHDIFSSLDDSFCASTQNWPLWVTNSVRKKFVILVWSPLLSTSWQILPRETSRKIMCLLLWVARHMINVKKRIGMIPGIYISCPTERGYNNGGGVNINAIPDSRPSLQSPGPGSDINSLASHGWRRNVNLLNPSWLGMGLFQRKLIREFREFKSVRKGKQINSLCPSISAFFFKQVLIGDR